MRGRRYAFGVLAILVFACSARKSAPEESSDPLALARRIASVDAQMSSLLSPREGAFQRDSESGHFFSEGYRGVANGRLDTLGARAPSASDQPLAVGVSRFDRLALRVTLSGSLPREGQLDGGRVLYRNVFPETDRILASGGEAMEELLVLRSAGAPSAFDWRIELASGIARVVEDAGGFSFEDRSGRRVLHVPTPYAIDSRGRRHMLASSFDAKTGRLRVALDSRSVVYPCVIDPVYEAWSWIEERVPVGTSGIAVRTFHDSTRQELIALTTTLGEPSMYGWNGTRWRHIGTGGSIPKDIVSAAHDPDLRQSVAYSGTLPDPTWVWDGSAWSQKTLAEPAALLPAARLAYASGIKKVVMYGGTADTWLWNGTAWTKAPDGPAPPPRRDHALVSRGTGVLLVGGRAVDPPYALVDDAWTFDGNTWTEVALSTPRPSARWDHSLTRANDGRIFLFGGTDAMSSVTDVWILSATGTWTLDAFSTPVNLGRPGFAWDVANDRALLVGGDGPRVSSRDAAIGWRDSVLPASPVSNHATAVDGRGDLTMVAADKTWKRFDASWSVVANAPANESRTRFAMAFDETTRLVVLHGGSAAAGGLRKDDTWLWNGTAWSLGPPAPLPRDEHGMATNPGGGVVVFGGTVSRPSGADEATNETWVLDGANAATLAWRSVASPTAPEVRGNHAMAYDPKSRRVILFGGRPGTGTPRVTYQDTWSWDGATWRKLDLSSKPPHRYGHAMAHDPDSGLFMLFGGKSPFDTSLNDTWLFDGTAWLPASARTAPPAGALLSLGYDAKRKEVVALGAGSTSTSAVASWTLSRIGTTCTSSLACPGSFCVDGVCCDSEQCSTCETCAGTRPGKCTPVANAEDADTCGIADKKSCSAESDCKAAIGVAQTNVAACASGFLVDGVCCDRACNGRCEACVASMKESGSADGVCDRATQAARPGDACNPLSCDGDHTLVGPDGTTQDCGAYTCEGASCKTRCTRISDCVGGDCTAGGVCVPFAKRDANAAEDGCATGGRNGARAFPFGVALMALIFVRRSRRLRATRSR